jgi:hypothetical protein
MMPTGNSGFKPLEVNTSEDKSQLSETKEIREKVTYLLKSRSLSSADRDVFQAILDKLNHLVETRISREQTYRYFRGSDSPLQTKTVNPAVERGCSPTKPGGANLGVLGLKLLKGVY